MADEINNDAGTGASKGKEEMKEKRNGGIYGLDPANMVIGDFHITMNKNLGNVDAISLLEQMHGIRNNTSMTSEEKAARVQQLINRIQI